MTIRKFQFIYIPSLINYEAIEKGFYSEEGLQVELSRLSST